jgi:hypothetical protein
LNFVPGSQILQGAEECIPVAGKADIPGVARQRRAGNVSDRAAESGLVDPFGNHRGKVKTRDLNAADQTGGCSGR